MIIIAFGLFLSGCGVSGDQNTDIQDSDEQTVSESNDPVSETDINANTNNGRINNTLSPNEITYDDVFKAFDRARDAVCWEYSENVELGNTMDESIAAKVDIYDYTLFREASYLGISTPNGLRAFMNDLFSRDITENILEWESYFSEMNAEHFFVLYDNKIYVCTDIARPNGIAEPYETTTSITIHKISDTEYQINWGIRREFTESTSDIDFEFIYEYIDGRWIFTKVPLDIGPPPHGSFIEDPNLSVTYN
ncbi:MAG: hypothetical protein ACI4PP_06765 [Clostridia bacterium]